LDQGEGINIEDMGIYQLFAADGTDIGAMMNRPPYVPVNA
jgi:hypothetical protein